MVHAGEGGFVGVHGRQQGAGAQGVEAAGVFDGDHGHLAVDHFELGSVALGPALGDELLVDDDGELGGVDLAAIGEGGELGHEGLAPGEVGSVAEEQGGGLRGVRPHEGDGGPAVLGDDVLELFGEDGVDLGEVGGDGGAGGGGLWAGEAAGGLILLEHGEQLVVEGARCGGLRDGCGRGSRLGRRRRGEKKAGEQIEGRSGLRHDAILRRTIQLPGTGADRGDKSGMVCGVGWSAGGREFAINRSL